MKNELIEELENLLGEWDYEYAEGDTIDTVGEYITDRINETEIIYYHRAIEYLTDTDPSLTEALILAEEYGYSAGDLNSEILATILYQQKQLEEWSELSNEAEDLLEQIAEADEDDD